MDIRVATTTPNAAAPSVGGTVFEAIFLLIVIVVGYFYLVAPKYDAYTTAKSALAAAEKQRADAAAQKDAFTTLAQTLQSSPDAVAALDAALPLDAKPSRLYVVLENILQRAGIAAGSVTVDNTATAVVAGAGGTFDEQANRSVQPTNIIVSATGTIDQLTQFLRALESSGRIFEVTDLSLNQGREGQVVFKVTVKAYAYAPVEGAAQ